VRVQVDPITLQGCVLALGSPHFPRALIDALNDDLSVDHVAILAFDTNLIPRLAGGASRTQPNVAEEAGRLYQESRFYRQDPGTQKLRGRAVSELPVLFRLRAEDIRDRNYRSQIYTRFGLLERVSLIQHVAGQWIILNLFRGKETGRFNRKEIDRLRSLSTLLVALAGKHVSLLTPQPARPPAPGAGTGIESLLASVGENLSARERAVCVRALRGLTVEGIALDLGVKPSTVATLRRRAYAKLNISSLNELFALCIGSLARSRLSS
jgi:DNA-binding CsgD family transcriptional regulator